MKKFTLSADFVKWDPADENSSEPDSFDYVIDLESEEEARVRLDALIIERMSSKPGWSYKLVNSSLGEFPVSDDAEGVKVIYDLPVLAPQNDAPGRVYRNAGRCSARIATAGIRKSNGNH